jgi:hypothetical protein
VHLRPRLHLPLLVALLAPAAREPVGQQADPPPEAEDSAAADTVERAGDGAAQPPHCAADPLDCDGVNNHCDDQTDEDAEVEGRILSGEDRDGDGGSTAAPTLGCPPVDMPVAPLAGGGECDDRDAARSPGTPEDGVSAGDEDCDWLCGCADLDCADPPCLGDSADGRDNELDGLTAAPTPGAAPGRAPAPRTAQTRPVQISPVPRAARTDLTTTRTASTPSAGAGLAQRTAPPRATKMPTASPTVRTPTAPVAALKPAPKRAMRTPMACRTAPTTSTPYTSAAGPTVRSA